MGVRRIAAVAFQQPRLGGASVRVEVTGLWVAGGPAVGLKIHREEQAVLYDGSDRIARVPRTAHVVALPSEQNAVPARLDPPAFFRLEQTHEAAARRGRHACFFSGKFRHGQERGRQIDQAHVVLDHPAWRLDAGGPAHRQRQMVGDVVLLPLAAGKGHPVVRRHDYEGVFQLACGLQSFEHASQVAVEMLHLHRVIQHVVADDFVVGPVSGHAVDVFEALAPL